MERILINCTGFIGDILFSSSVAQKLKQQKECTVDYLIHLVQPYHLLKQNPFIDNVHLYQCDTSQYSEIITLHGVNHNYPPAMWFQMEAGIKHPDSLYKVYTLPEYDEWAADQMRSVRKDKPIVAVMDGWREKTYKFTEAQYEAGIDVPNLGYGGSHRNISYILKHLQDKLDFVSVGKPAGFNVRSESDSEGYTATASLLKYCDAFIGTEGGLANLAFGVGTKTILTGDYVHQLYGWNGVIEKNATPKLGPVWYGDGHTEIDPYATDDEVVEIILKNI